MKLQKSIVKHRDRVLAAIEHGLSNGLVESTNTKVRLITRMAYGFASPEPLIALALLSLGGTARPSRAGNDPRISQESPVFYPFVRVDSAPVAAVGSAGGVLLTTAAEVTGLSSALRDGLSRWRKPAAVHDPGKVLTDLSVTLALGGDCLADAAIIRSEPGIYGRVASEATVSRTITALAGDADRVLAAVAAARARAWELAGEHAPNHAVTADDPLVVDLDATLVTTHSEKAGSASTFSC